ncbi:MAG: VWA domain-containing protein [Clostridia bacterium]|nr:VWA domain-containing protein [Clostridia bacterium]
MKNISFDNPYLLLLAIPIALAIIIPYFISKNKDNKTVTWLISLCVHIVIIAIVILAVAGLSTESVLTETTVYVVADVSYSSNRNLDEIDDYIAQIKESLPEKAKMGVVCFGKESIILTPVGRKIKSVSEAKLDDSGTDIVGALNYTGTLFQGDSLKRIILITDGNDTVSNSASSIASVVERLTENDIKIDAIFLDNTVKEDETEIQLLNAEYSKSIYIGHENEAKFLIQASHATEVILELYSRVINEDGTESEFEKLGQTVVLADGGLTTVRMELPADEKNTYEYKAQIVHKDDISSYNNTRTFTQKVVDKAKILLVTGKAEDVELIKGMYGSNAEIDSYVISGNSNRVPVTLEELVNYDEFVVSNLDIRNIRNVNAFIDSMDMVISQYGKSLVTLGNLQLHTNTDDPIFKKFQELLPVNFGSTRRDGRLYTIVLDVSHSMFMASKFTIAKNAATNLISVLDDEDYICLVTFSGVIKVETPKKVKDCKDDLVSYINSLTTSHGTDVALGLEEALKAVKSLNLTENQVMVISDGFSFDSERTAVEVSKDLFDAGATVSAIDTYIYSDGDKGKATMQSIVNAGKGGNYYEIMRPEDVTKVVFGSVAEDFAEVVIEKDAAVTIAKHKDDIVKGLTSLPVVSGYVLSLEKYDAIVPITITYQKNNGYQETVPLYAYRAHGNGKVSTLTSSLTGSWTAKWSEDVKSQFVNNLFVSNTPKERVDYPFTVNIDKNEYNAYIEIIPSVLNTEAKTTIVITLPTGKRLTRNLVFDSKKYSYSFTTGKVGTYSIEIKYEYDDSKFTTKEEFEIPYLSEYDAFTTFDKFEVYEFMRGNGEVLVNEIPSLENDKNKVTTYKVSFVIPLLIGAISLFVIDVFIRKLRVKKKVRKGDKK